MDTIKVIWKSKTKTDKIGYLRISSRVAGKTILRSLPLEPVEKKHFNSNTQRMRVSFFDFERYNNTIETKLDELKKKGNKIKLLNDDKKSFLSFMDYVIEKNSTNNSGTKLKYQGLRNLVYDFNVYKYGVSDVKFSDITLDFLIELKKYLQTVRNNANNSIFYKFRGLNSFISKASKEGVFTFEVNPFRLIFDELTLIETDVDILNKEDLQKLMTTSLEEVYRSGKKKGKPLEDLSVLSNKKYTNYLGLDEFRSFFLFQLFSQGLRVSDVLTLRWQDFYVTNNNQIRFKKRMVKVKSFIDILVNDNTIEYLLRYIPTDADIPDKYRNIISTIYFMKMNPSIAYDSRSFYKGDISNTSFGIELDKENLMKYNLNFQSVSNKYYISINEVKTLIEDRKKHLSSKIKTKDLVIHNQKLETLLSIDNKTFYLEKLLVLLEKEIVNMKESIIDNYSTYKKDIYNKLTELIDYLSNNKDTKKMFVFPLLDNKDFENIKDDFYSMNEIQYSKFTGRRSYYNSMLKTIAEQCGINKPLSTHIARHSYTSLMIEIGENLNLFDLMTSLGHKSINTTVRYINKFSAKRVDDLNKNIVNYLDINN